MYYNKIYMTAIPLKKPILKKLMDMIDGILKGKYEYAGGEERLYISDHQYVKLNYSSSGQQEVIWILNLMFYYILRKSENLSDFGGAGITFISGGTKPDSRGNGTIFKRRKSYARNNT